MKHGRAGQAEVIGVEGMQVTAVACKVVERAGYSVYVTTVSRSDLSFVSGDLGTAVLPTVITEHGTFQGMKQIRSKFEA